MTKLKEKSETRTKLIEYSSLARKIKAEGIDQATNEQELIYWSYRGINDIIKNEIYFIGGKELKTFSQWKAEGATIMRGAKGFPLWGQPLKANAKVETPEEADETSAYEYWPICILFSREQVLTPQDKAKTEKETTNQPTAVSETEAINLDLVL